MSAHDGLFETLRSVITNELLHEGIRVEKMAKERYGPHAVVGVPKIDESKDVPKTVVEPHLRRKLSESGAEITHGGVTTLEYGGYDVFALCKRRGLALPAHDDGARHRGCLQGKTYGFADEYGAKQFASQPAKYVRAMHATLFRMPELVRITHPSGEATARAFPNLDVAKVAAGMSVASPTEFGTQTDTHPVERHVDKDYEWNEWALRRRALHAANLLRKATHGSQTHSSHFRRGEHHSGLAPEEERDADRGDQGDDDAAEEEVHRRHEGRAGRQAQRGQRGAGPRPTVRALGRRDATNLKICDGFSPHLASGVPPPPKPDFPLFFQC